ncbi:MAG: glutamine amidotransferase [Chloroflexi bacterium]|nr:MAG: glutamine amidotransferase [Chloroflexota bacterium]TMD68006.1 MAG: glutamine amidotransferase [Chloroflexota bacterium]
MLRIAHLYPDEMNIYGDRGNILTLQKRAQWRGIQVEVRAIGRGPSPDLSDVDLIFWGGGQDRDQELVFTDAATHKVESIRGALADGAVVLAVCGGYQLLGEYYVTAEGKQLPGLELVELHTVPGPKRNIGNIVIETRDLGLQPATLVGFENHSGRTYLGPGLTPLGRVLRGAGNNGQDGTEGVAAGNIFGTYLHGSLLPKNPHFADLLLDRALRRRGSVRLQPLDDTVELSAHETIRARVGAAG